MANDYARALNTGKRQVKEAARAGRNPYVEVLDEKIGDAGVMRHLALGTMEIPLAMVVGTRTSGRKNLLSCGFMPLAEQGTEFAAKWQSLLDAQRAEGMRDPVVAYEYLHRFYVQEGNKRVSVANYLGMATILARVTRIMPIASQEEGHAAYSQFLRFFSACPIWELEFSDAGSYKHLADLLRLSLDEVWPEDLVLKLKAFYAHFAKAYRGREGSVRRSTDVPDAFLEYLTARPEDDLHGMSEREIRKKARLTEVRLATGEEAMAQKQGLKAAPAVTSTVKAVVAGTAKSALSIGAQSLPALSGQKKSAGEEQ